ncbi:MAG: hypothetical protein D6742_00095 [Cyanobacteria bacterium J069]|nr:MAG: hypothetical protein D6742_00095 [Cyanobacteria bacterium J069]
MALFLRLWHLSNLQSIHQATGRWGWPAGPRMGLLAAIALGGGFSNIAPATAEVGEQTQNIAGDWGQLVSPSLLIAPQQMAQRVVEGLPPPPGESGGSFYSQPGAAVGSDGRSTTAQFPGQQYLVVVNGNSPLLLSQVQQIAPTAGLQSYQGQQVIQAGVFGEEWTAAQQVQALAEQGIAAQVVAVAGGVVPVQPGYPTQPVYPASTQASLDSLPPAPGPAEVPFGQYPALEPQPVPSYEYGPPTRSNGYYVIIPGSGGSLARVSEQVRLLSDGFPVAGRVQERDRPNGPHVLVGPFSGRGAAERWNRYFRDFGLNARVHYER